VVAARDVALHDIAAHDIAAHEMDCGVAGRIPQGALLEPTRTVWDAALHSWEVSVRCVHPADCVPFLVRVPDHNSSSEIASSARQASAAAQRITAPSALSPASGKPLVRSGEAVTLLWDQDGIRLVAPAICIDPGGAGQSVRARIAPHGRLVRAIVMSAGQLRTAS